MVVRASRLGLYEHANDSDILRYGIRSQERSVHIVHDSSGGVQAPPREVKLALKQRQASMMYTMRSMMAKVMTDDGRSEPGGGTGGRVAVRDRPGEVGISAVGESPRGAVLTAEIR